MASSYADIEAELLAEQEKRNKPKSTTKKAAKTTNHFKVVLFAQEGYSLSVKPSAKKFKYTLYCKDEIIDEHTIDKTPGDCNKDTKFINNFIKQLEGNVLTVDTGLKYTKDQITIEFMKHLRELQSQLDVYESNKEDIKAQKKYEAEQERLVIVEENYKLLNELLNKEDKTIIDYIQWCITYLINGENKNVLIGLFCHLSTYFKRGPLWFMAVGKSGEGKSTIEQASIRLLPTDAWMNGNMTEAALYRKTIREGKDFLDGKIMRLGDLGGEHDFKKYAPLLNQYKELSTEGRVELEVTSDTISEESQERETTSLVLEGYPSVSFATVKSEDIDDQYSNRGRIIEPEATNDHVRKFNLFFKGYYYDKVNEVIEYYINQLLHDYLEYIRIKYVGVKVFNPYLTCLHNWLEDDEYFKRSIGQYEKIVETVTLLCYDDREKISNPDGDVFVVSTMDDNKLVSDLFLPSFGISPVAIRLFNKILDWFYKARDSDKENMGFISCECNEEEYKESVKNELSDYQSGEKVNINNFISLFTVSMVKHKASKINNLKGLRYGEILSTLVNNGYILDTAVKVRNRNNNIYCLGRFEPIDNKKIKFDGDCVNQYLTEVVPCTYGISNYVPGTFQELKNIENEDELRECSFDGLGVAQWF